MKRFWLVLLSLGLVMAFSASAFAVDVKFSGSYFAASDGYWSRMFCKSKGKLAAWKARCDTTEIGFYPSGR